MEIKLKRDSFRAERGGQSKLIDILCAGCGSRVLLYQKDGIGSLRRCYLNRILAPKEYADLQKDSSITGLGSMPQLTCGKCKKQIGVPMMHSDGRLAFRLIPGAFARKLEKEVRYRT